MSFVMIGDRKLELFWRFTLIYDIFGYLCSCEVADIIQGVIYCALDITCDTMAVYLTFFL